MVTDVDAIIFPQVNEIIVYETVYVPAALSEGLMVPADASIVSPAGAALKVPPAVPVKVTARGLVFPHQAEPE